ncbi:50S ribosomal protein L6 [Flavilitoribacter nigricans]|uniref:Large ribosomal subunit protein uL6 n=1 Tax=Flavilitoribacter nigricans (strain ATCC 23147 / DSM 23189 / NBRC 102662 / NCIMB 1420 / SS-2) TaxID=1122177 RepID=A0A2D0N815_FLAN2|nr:50S ribosomal protein L6 [Flavilitoribacter nigricans]PHN04538.1 50S ribosomal protein L6 [Flavilitoribacter nigricans DSM 23189 = NBRC 102662]
MSRVGNAPISIPNGVQVDISKGNLVTVKGPKGELQQQLNPDLSVNVEDGELSVSRPTDSKRHKSLHGLSRALINNMVEGVSNGFVLEMEVIGVGYRVENKGNLLILTLGFSHPIYFYVPDEVNVETAMEKGKAPLIRLQSADKQLVGQVAAKIRSFRKPEPYKGKGIRFKGEQIRRKAGKTAGK